MFTGRVLKGQIDLAKTDHSQSASQQRFEDEQRLSDELAVVNSYQAGMTRAQLLERFSPTLGLSSASHGRFVINSNWCIKVEVEFSVTTDGDGRSVFGPDDRIIKISRPYLNCSGTG